MSVQAQNIVNAINATDEFGPFVTAIYLADGGGTNALAAAYYHTNILIEQAKEHMEETPIGRDLKRLKKMKTELTKRLNGQHIPDGVPMPNGDYLYLDLKESEKVKFSPQSIIYTLNMYGVDTNIQKSVLQNLVNTAQSQVQSASRKVIVNEGGPRRNPAM